MIASRWTSGSHVVVFLLAASCSSSSADGGASSPPDPHVASCATPAVLSCTDAPEPDFYSCHEFYSSEAATMIASTCDQLKQTQSKQSCGSQFKVCCLSQKGSNGYPESVCGTGTDPTFVEHLKAQCNYPGDTICNR